MRLETPGMVRGGAPSPTGPEPVASRVQALLGARVVGLSKRFGQVQALDGVDLEIPSGAVTAVLGKNGAGKTTLIRILATSVVADSGQAWIDGVDLAKDPVTARCRVGVVLGEDRSFFWRLSGRQNLEFFAALRGLRRRDARRAADEALAAVELSAVADRRVDRYSSGMRSRLGISRALLGAPSVLLLDEPTRSLDPAVSHEIREVLRSLAVERGVAVFLATHDLHEAAALAAQVVVLEQGKVATRLDGSADAGALEDLLVEPRR